jgi:hypothetical protein
MLFSVALAEVELQSTAVSTGMSTWQVRRRLIKAHLPSRWDATGFALQRDVCFLVGGITVHEVDGRERNWLVDDFARVTSGRSVVMQWRPHGSRRPAFSPTRSLDAMVARSDLRARLRPPTDVQTSAVRRLVTEYARQLEHGLSEAQLEGIVLQALSLERIRRPIDEAFASVLDRVRPRVVIMEDASYGARASLIRMMKERGVHVAEPQHGWIGPSHAAYNFGSTMREEEMRATLPDTVLTFGSFWSEGVRHPADLVAIGKPHLEAQAELAPAIELRPRNVLVISSVADVEGTSDFVLALREGLPDGWTVRFRPHPSERSAYRKRYPRLAAPGVEFDLEGDVYRSMAEARAVVGAASTVLFEAVAMGCPVYVQQSQYFDYYVGDTFGSAFDGAAGAHAIADEITAGAALGPLRIGRDAMWAAQPRSAFARWLHGVGVDA